MYVRTVSIVVFLGKWQQRQCSISHVFMQRATVHFFQPKNLHRWHGHQIMDIWNPCVYIPQTCHSFHACLDNAFPFFLWSVEFTFEHNYNCLYLNDKRFLLIYHFCCVFRVSNLPFSLMWTELQCLYLNDEIFLLIFHLCCVKYDSKCFTDNMLSNSKSSWLLHCWTLWTLDIKWTKLDQVHTS